jgi:hypothetical protein
MTIIETLAVGEDVPLQLVDGQAPREIRLFRRGENPSTKGSFLFDDTAAQKVMSAYERMGRRWVIADYDHGSLQRNPVDPSRSARSAGKASLELRDGELWATNIQWTPSAKASIEAGEWPSVSPAFAHGEDRRPTWLMNFGLTGNPALHAPAELVAASALRAIFDPTDPDEPEAAASTNTGAEPARTEAAAEVTEKLHMKTRTAAELAEFLGWAESDASTLLSMWSGRTKAISGTTVALSVGLAAEAEEKAVVERLHALAGTEREIFAELNAKDKAEALGAITGLKEAAKTAASASAELAEVKGRQIRSEVDALLNGGKDIKKLTPAEIADESENGLRATALSKGDKATVWLKAHIANRPVIAALSTSVKEPDEKTQTEGSGSADREPEWMAGKKYAELSIKDKERLSAEAPALFERLSAEYRQTLRSQNQTALHAR